MFILLSISHTVSDAPVIHYITAHVNGSAEMRLGDQIFNENVKCIAAGHWYGTMSTCAFISKVIHSENYATSSGDGSILCVCGQGQHVLWHLFTLTFSRYTHATALPGRCSWLFSIIFKVLVPKWEFRIYTASVSSAKMQFPGVAAAYYLTFLFVLHPKGSPSVRSPSHISHKTE